MASHAQNLQFGPASLSFYLFLGFLTKNTHYLCQNSKFLCCFVAPLSQMIEVSEFYQLVCFSPQANEMARSY
jgi:hypothetical protein